MTASRLPVRIAGLGAHLPTRVVTNDDFARRLDTDDAWIRSRTGIRERRIAEPHEATSDLAIAAGAKAIADSGIDASQLGAVVVCTTTPDHPMPGTAPIVASGLGLAGVQAFDLQAACTGFVTGLEVVGALVAASGVPALLVGADTLSRIVDPEDRATAVLFGDGAGAVVLAPDRRAVLGPFESGSDGDLAAILRVEAGGSRLPATPELVAAGRHQITMQGGEVYRHAVERMAASSLAVLARAGLAVDEVDLVVGHQANARILDAVARRAGFDAERLHLTVGRHGNTSAASIPLALADARDTGRLHPGDVVLLTAFGAGLTWGSALLTWS